MKPFKQHLYESCGCQHSEVPDSEDIEMKLVDNVADANTEDLRELPGEAGKRRHGKLHAAIQNLVTKMRGMHESKQDPKDGDYTDAPPLPPMSDSELEAYYQDWMKRKGKK